MPKAKLNYTDRLAILRKQQAVEKEKRAKEKKRLAAMTPEQQAAEEARQTDREARRELKKMLAAGVDIESTYAGSKGVRGMRVLALFREANGNVARTNRGWFSGIAGDLFGKKRQYSDAKVAMINQSAAALARKAADSDDSIRFYLLKGANPNTGNPAFMIFNSVPFTADIENLVKSSGSLFSSYSSTAKLTDDVTDSAAFTRDYFSQFRPGQFDNSKLAIVDGDRNILVSVVPVVSITAAKGNVTRLNPATGELPDGYSVRIEDGKHLICFNDEPTGKYALSASRAKELAAKMAKRNGKGRKQS